MPYFVADCICFGLVGGADNDEFILLPFSEFAVEDAAEANVQSYCGFVYDNHVWLSDESTGKGCLLTDPPES